MTKDTDRIPVLKEDITARVLNQDTRHDPYNMTSFVRRRAFAPAQFEPATLGPAICSCKMQSTIEIEARYARNTPYRLLEVK